MTSLLRNLSWLNIVIWPWIKKIVAVGDKYPVDLNWKRENVLEYGCNCNQPAYVKSDWFNETVHNSSWFATEAQKTVIIGGTWYQSGTTWIDENQYYCSYKNETKLMQKDKFDFSGPDSDLVFLFKGSFSNGRMQHRWAHNLKKWKFFIRYEERFLKRYEKSL